MRLLATLLFALPLWAAQFHSRNGTTTEANLLNPSITVHTAYGSLPVPATELARVYFGSGGDQDAIITRTGNRLSGFINDPIRKDDVIVLKSTLSLVDLAPIAPSPSQRFLVLANGDILSGDFSLPDLPDASAAHAIWFERNTTKVRVQTASGKETLAEFPTNQLSLSLDWGVAVEVPRELLKALYLQEGAVPPELHRLIPVTASGSNSVPSYTPAGMVWIGPGKVLLGSPLDERGRNSDEGPQTEVTISRGFWMGKFEVTQGEYASVIGQNPSTFQGDTNRPVEKVSWHEALEYCARLTERARREGSLPNGYVYRLPTEAEWEYACRAGSQTSFSFGEDPSERELPAYAWFAANSGWTTQPVGKLKPNGWGLHDMHGNVLEWCLGLWNDAYPGGRLQDYNGPGEGWLRVARGGSWLYGAVFARSANRDDYGPGNRCSDLGFRVVLAAPL